MNIKKHNIVAALSLAAIVAATSCSEGNGWKIDGTVAAAADSMLYIEGSTPAGWYVMDSVEVASDGSFTYRAAEGAAIPSIYRLRMAGKYIYFPIDSVETVTITGTGNAFDRAYTLAGNSAAEGFARVDSLIAASIDALGADGAMADSTLRRNLNVMVNTDTTCLVSYYIVGKFIGTKPLYDLTSRADLRTVANAAQNYKMHRPDDPRAAELEQRWYAGRRAIGAVPTVQREATLSARPQADLKRYDKDGNMHDFDKVVTRGTGPTILSLTRYDSDMSPVFTAALKEVYDKHHAQGLEIFQVGYDANEVAWKRSAANMPWIAVWNAPGDNTEALIRYNANPIDGQPVCFIFDKDGDLIQRITDPKELDAAVAALL